MLDMMRLTLVSPVLMWAIIILGAATLLIALPDRRLFTGIPAVTLLLAACWIAMLVSALAVHKEAPLSAAGVHKIVSTGPYRYVRHPVYAADILLAFGVIIGFPRTDLVVAALFAITVFLVWMRLEEAALLQRFGKEYAEYCKRTPMLIPRIRGL